MINRLLLLKPYISYLCSQPDVELTNLNDAQWKLLGDIVIILEPFMLAQKLLEGETYVTLSLVVSIIEGLRKQLARAASNVDNSAYVQSMRSSNVRFCCPNRSRRTSCTLQSGKRLLSQRLVGLTRC